METDLDFHIKYLFLVVFSQTSDWNRLGCKGKDIPELWESDGTHGRACGNAEMGERFKCDRDCGVD